MNRHIELGVADRDESRPFAYTQHNTEDMAAIVIMAAQLRQLIQDSQAPAPLDRSLPNEFSTIHGRRLRAVVTQLEALRRPQDVLLVGFFGHRRPDVPPDVDEDKDTIDAELIAELPQYPGVLGYSTVEINTADYGNLVLLERPESAEEWRTSARHGFAARVIAPRYYTTIRLHNGVLPGGLFSGQAPVLLRTKYYDYRGEWPWTAVREYNQA
jgi:hypothetical protein